MSNSKRLILPHSLNTSIKRNPDTGRIFPCCFEDCEKPGLTTIEFKVPHDKPRWRDPETGEQEMLVYIFCTEFHRNLFMVGSSYARQDAG